MWVRTLAALLAIALVPACQATSGDPGAGSGAGGKADDVSNSDLVQDRPNLAAGSSVLYEVQVRVANACRVDVGSPEQRQACQAKPAPNVQYRAPGSCGELNELQKIKLGTLDDMLADTTDYRQGITLSYIKNRVGANVVWLMPLFPNNDDDNIPSDCDNLGSPYAVRDYLHASGMLSSACIAQGHDEHDADAPCWGNDSLEAVIAKAHALGLKVMLDVAFNHFGRGYRFYDYVGFRPVRARTGAGEDLNALWRFRDTFDPAYLNPEILDNPDKLAQAAASDEQVRSDLDGLQARCPNLQGYPLVRAFNMWREAFDGERAQFSCEDLPLEQRVPGYYLGQNHWDPSSQFGDNFTNDWRDVRFLYHHETNTAHQWEFARQREYLFRVLNYWVSRGVDGFRLDHTTDYFGGMTPNEWKYLFSKVDFYAGRRGQARPVYLAEEFGDQVGMSHVADVLTEGYIGDLAHAFTKDAAHVQDVMRSMKRFGDLSFVMTALEDHDERRLLDNTGFDIWTGAGFWGIGATTRSTPMMLMGQEFGEPWQLAFRKSDFLRSRFVGTDQYNPQGDSLVAFYANMIGNRLDPRNEALLQPSQAFLPTRDAGAVDPRIFAAVKWAPSSGNVVFTFHNLWHQGTVRQAYVIPPEVASAIYLRSDVRYRLVDVISGQQKGDCRYGGELQNDLYVEMDDSTRMQWLRLELCN